MSTSVPVCLLLGSFPGASRQGLAAQSEALPALALTSLALLLSSSNPRFVPARLPSPQVSGD